MQPAQTGSIAKRRILVVEDHPLVRESVIRLLAQQPDLEPCGGVDAFKDVAVAVTANRPDLILLDLWLTDGEALGRIPALKAVFPNLPILVLSQLDETLYAERALKAGASGYIMKEQASHEVLDAIRFVLQGHVYVSRKMAVRLGTRFEGLAQGTPPTEPGGLSDREIQVMQFLGVGMSTRQIAAELDLSIKTVETYRDHLKGKLGLQSAADLIGYATSLMQGESPSPERSPGHPAPPSPEAARSTLADRVADRG